MWSSILNRILEFDDVRLLQKYIARFSDGSIRSMNPGKGWRIPRSNEMLAELLKHGTDVNARDWYGRTWLHYAALKETPDLAGWLLKHGAEIDAIDHQSGTTPLGLAAWNGGADIVDFLLVHGANLQLPKDDQWARPLTFAKAQGHSEIVKRLEQSA